MNSTLMLRVASLIGLASMLHRCNAKFPKMMKWTDLDNIHAYV